MRHPFFVDARENGFTLTELVMVIAIVAVIAVFAAPRFSRTVYDTRTVYDELFAQVAYARKAAIAQRRAVCVHLGAAQSVLRYDDNTPGTCNAASTGVASPGGTAPFTINAGTTVFAPAVVFRFDALGRYLTAGGADPGAALVVTVTGDGAPQFTVERGTGYVHP